MTISYNWKVTFLTQFFSNCSFLLNSFYLHSPPIHWSITSYDQYAILIDSFLSHTASSSIQAFFPPAHTVSSAHPFSIRIPFPSIHPPPILPRLIHLSSPSSSTYHSSFSSIHFLFSVLSLSFLSLRSAVNPNSSRC